MTSCTQSRVLQITSQNDKSVWVTQSRVQQPASQNGKSDFPSTKFSVSVDRFDGSYYSWVHPVFLFYKLLCQDMPSKQEGWLVSTWMDWIFSVSILFMDLISISSMSTLSKPDCGKQQRPPKFKWWYCCSVLLLFIMTQNGLSAFLLDARLISSSETAFHTAVSFVIAPDNNHLTASQEEFYSCRESIDDYHGDKHIFSDNKLDTACVSQVQANAYSSCVRAHHQNSVAERAIRTVTNSAHTLLLHASIIQWPEENDFSLWPFALDYVFHLWNNNLPKPTTTRLSQAELFFCGTKIDHALMLQAARVFGAPAFVLDPTFQDRMKFPKWQPRSHSAQFMGLSRDHAKTVGLVHTFQPGFVSPQFHIVDDNHFTIPNQYSEIEVPPQWDKLYKYISVRLIEPETDPYPAMSVEEQHLHLALPLSDEWLTAEERATQYQREQLASNSSSSDATGSSAREGAASNDVDDEDLQTDQQTVDRSRVDSKQTEQQTADRSRENPTRLFQDRSHRGSVNPHAGSFSFVVRAIVADTPSFHEAMNNPDPEDFRNAFQLKIHQLNGKFDSETGQKYYVLNSSEYSVQSKPDFIGARACTDFVFIIGETPFLFVNERQTMPVSMTLNDFLPLHSLGSQEFVPKNQFLMGW